MKGWPRRRASEQRQDDSISLEDLAWRIGASDTHPEAPRHDHRTTEPAALGGRVPRRGALWRDVSAFVLGTLGFVLVVELSLSGGARNEVAGATSMASSSVSASGNAVEGPSGLIPTIGPTIGLVIDPSLVSGLGGTPSGIPVIRAAPGAPGPRRTPPPTSLPTAQSTPGSSLPPTVTAGPTLSSSPTSTPASSPSVGPSASAAPSVVPVPTDTPTPTLAPIPSDTAAPTP